jgi:hypothetical protein
VPVSRPRRGDCGTGCLRSRLAGVESGTTSTMHVDHSIDGSHPTFRSLRRLRRRATDGHPRDVEGSCRSLHCDVGDDIDHPRRSLPSTAHVQRSAVSGGFAAGRLTGTRGTSKAHVEHSIVESGTTSTTYADHSIEMSRRTTMVVVEHFHQGPTTNLPEGTTSDVQQREMTGPHDRPDITTSSVSRRVRGRGPSRRRLWEGRT